MNVVRFMSSHIIQIIIAVAVVVVSQRLLQSFVFQFIFNCVRFIAVLVTIITGPTRHNTLGAIFMILSSFFRGFSGMELSVVHSLHKLIFTYIILERFRIMTIAIYQSDDFCQLVS